MSLRPLSSWREPETAKKYGEFVAAFPMYGETSRDVVARAGVLSHHRVLDLCCGTGATTRAALDALGDEGHVVAVDGSPEMLEVARATTSDPRVAWVDSEAELVAGSVAGPFDSAVCNSAIWQVDMPAVFSAVHGLLAPGGRFVSNVGSQFIVLPGGPEVRQKPGLLELMHAFAVVEFDFVPPPFRGGGGGGGRGPLTIPGFEEMVRQAGFRDVGHEVVEYVRQPEELLAWLSIPIFTERQFPGLDYETRIQALDRAYARWEKRPEKSRWVLFTAHK